jgi:hypothetical protein
LRESDNGLDAFLAGQSPGIGAADRDRIGAQRKGLEDVGPAPETAVDQHRNSAADAIAALVSLATGDATDAAFIFGVRL